VDGQHADPKGRRRARTVGKAGPPPDRGTVRGDLRGNDRGGGARLKRRRAEGGGWDKDRIVGLLLEAGELARRAREALSWDLKSDDSIVTQADREIEALFTRELEDPGRGVHIIGEETIEAKGEDYVRCALREEAFVIDPIDGTAPFAHELPNWGVSVGYLQGGRLTEGAIFLPDYGEGEVIIGWSPAGESPVVEEGRRDRSGRDEGWHWRVLPRPQSPPRAGGLVAITQELAKRGRCELPNPVMALGAAVVPLAGLLQGRFLAYLGKVRLWDVAGALPLLLRYGFSATIEVSGAGREVGRGGARGEVRRVGAEVDDSLYFLDAGDPRRWFFRGSLLICRPEDEARMREALIEDPSESR
jgi:myo-inositol-1(or 4)-monophosphatase